MVFDSSKQRSTHRGQIVEAAIRRSGYSISKVAQQLHMSRNNLYQKFRQRYLEDDVVIRIGKIIRYDFKEDIDDLQATDPEDLTDIETKNLLEIWDMEKKYALLLERYTRLLNILLQVSAKNESEELKKKIREFMEVVDKGSNKKPK